MWKFSGVFSFVDLAQHPLEPVGEGTFHLEGGLGGGMDEAQLPGVEALAHQSGQRLAVAAVDGVAHQRMADGSLDLFFVIHAFLTQFF